MYVLTILVSYQSSTRKNDHIWAFSKLKTLKNFMNPNKQRYFLYISKEVNGDALAENTIERTGITRLRLFRLEVRK